MANRSHKNTNRKKLQNVWSQKKLLTFCIPAYMRCYRRSCSMSYCLRIPFVDRNSVKYFWPFPDKKRCDARRLYPNTGTPVHSETDKDTYMHGHWLQWCTIVVYGVCQSIKSLVSCFKLGKSFFHLFILRKISLDVMP